MIEIDRGDFLRGVFVVGGTVAGSAFLEGLGLSRIIHSGFFGNHLVSQPDQLHHRLKLGFSFSAKAAEDLGLDSKKDFEQLIKMGFDMVRLSWRLDRSFEENSRNINFQLDIASGLEVCLVFGDKQFPFPDYFPPPGLNIFDPNYSKKSLQFMEETYQRIADKGYFEKVDVVQISNEPFSFFRKNANNPPQALEFIEKIMDMLSPLNKDYLITDSLFNQSSDSWHQVRKLNPKYLGVDIYQQMGGTHYSLDQITTETEERFPPSEYGWSIENGYVTEAQIFPWPFDVPILGHFSEEELGAWGIFTDLDRDNIFYLAVNRFPRVFPWEVDKALAYSRRGEPRQLAAVKGFLEKRDYWNKNFKEASISSLEQHTSQSTL